MNRENDLYNSNRTMDVPAHPTLLSEGYVTQPEGCSSFDNGSTLNEHLHGGVMPIAVVGIGCRFPGGASNPAKFWEMIANGRSGWSRVPPDRFTESSFHHSGSGFGGTVNFQTTQW